MKISKDIVKVEGVRFSMKNDDREVGRATLYLMINDLHENPFGLLEDVFIDKAFRGQGIGSELINNVVNEAKTRGCYKLIATSRYSRPKVHELYLHLGFIDYGKEFRMDIG